MVSVLDRAVFHDSGLDTLGTVGPGLRCATEYERLLTKAMYPINRTLLDVTVRYNPNKRRVNPTSTSLRETQVSLKHQSHVILV